MSTRKVRGNGEVRDPSKVHSALVLQASSSFSGPLPPPELLARYNEIVPNGAERIMAMAEKQSAHRERLEARVVDGNVAAQTRGSYFAFMICLVALILAFVLIYQGKSAQGLSIVIASLCSLVAVFFYSKHEQRKERSEKAQLLQARRPTR